MAIPKIDPYPLPGTECLPRNAVSWRPDAARSVLLIHDMQRYFLRAFDAASCPLPALLENIAELREECRRLQVPVVYSAQPGGQIADERGLLMDFWGAGLSADLDSTSIVESLSPGSEDKVITKRRYSAFHRTELLEYMQCAQRDQLIICGVYAHIGCLATALEAFMIGIQAFVVSDAVADFSEARHGMALEYVAARCGCVLPLESVKKDLAASSRLSAHPVAVDALSLRNDPSTILATIHHVTKGQAS
jgi:bifunctional isochorismate lyase / aryl carrier protein